MKHENPVTVTYGGQTAMKPLNQTWFLKTLCENPLNFIFIEKRRQTNFGRTIFNVSHQPQTTKATKSSSHLNVVALFVDAGGAPSRSTKRCSLRHFWNNNSRRSIGLSYVDSNCCCSFLSPLVDRLWKTTLPSNSYLTNDFSFEDFQHNFPLTNRPSSTSSFFTSFLWFTYFLLIFFHCRSLLSLSFLKHLVSSVPSLSSCSSVWWTSLSSICIFIYAFLNRLFLVIS